MEETIKDVTPESTLTVEQVIQALRQIPPKTLFKISVADMGEGDNVLDTLDFSGLDYDPLANRVIVPLSAVHC